MPEIAEAAEVADKLVVECVHRWVLRSLQNSNGVTTGQCKLCGTEREFTNASNQWSRPRKVGTS